MPVNLKQLSPPIQVGDKLVRVRALTRGGVKVVIAEFTKADLPLPKLSMDSIAAGFADIQAFYAAVPPGDSLSAEVAQQAANAKLYEILATLAADNLPVITHWIGGHAAILDALVLESSNLTPEEVDQLSGGDHLRIAKAAWDELAADGFFTGAVGFFGGLVGLKAKQASEAPANPNQTPASGEASSNVST